MEKKNPNRMLDVINCSKKSVEISYPEFLIDYLAGTDCFGDLFALWTIYHLLDKQQHPNSRLFTSNQIKATSKTVCKILGWSPGRLAKRRNQLSDEELIKCGMMLSEEKNQYGDSNLGYFVVLNYEF